MKNLNSIISGLSKSGVLSGFAGGMAGGALTGALTSKKGRKMGGSALKLGALAAVGGVAWKAYQAYSQKNSMQQNIQPSAQAASQQPIRQSTYTPSSQPNRAPLTYSPESLSQRQFDAVIEEESDNGGQMLLLRAMITAANADGHIDENERQRIYEQVGTLELSVADKASLFDELRNPMTMPALVNSVPNSESAVEVYAASLLAIDENQPASQGYLNQLASNLMIPQELVSALHQEAGVG